MTEHELRRYARVILEVGVGLRAGQDLAINAYVEHADFARILCDEAYRAGAELVDIWYWDPHAKLARLSHARLESLSRTPEWLDARYRRLAGNGGALINLAGDPQPDLLRDVDPARAGLDRMPGLASRYEIQTRNEVQWCFAAVPTEGWARQVLGRPDVDALWRHLVAVLRLDAPDPVAAWWARMEELLVRCAALDEELFDGLHYPTRTEGTVRASRPLALGGALVEDLELRFEGGRISDVSATRGAEVVRAQLAIDDGAARLGEVALVDDTSPIQQSGVLFYDTLLDESAASHLAWGGGIPDGHRDYEPARPETLSRLPINHSATHVDFMIGSPELRVTGVRADGSRRVILDGERWAL